MPSMEIVEKQHFMISLLTCVLLLFQDEEEKDEDNEESVSRGNEGLATEDEVLCAA